MTIAQMRKLCNEKPDLLTDEEFDNIELIVISGDSTIHYLSESAFIKEITNWQGAGEEHEIVMLLPSESFEDSVAPDKLDELPDRGAEEIMQEYMDAEEQETPEALVRGEDAIPELMSYANLTKCYRWIKN